jgi:hypothetical protein
VSIVFASKVAMGHVQVGSRMFSINPVQEGVVSIAEIDQSKFPPELEPIVPKKQAAKGDRRGEPRKRRPGSVANIKVMVVLPTPSFDMFCNNFPIQWLPVIAAAFQNNLDGVFNAIRSTDVHPTVVAVCAARTPVGGDLNADLTWLRTDPGIAALRDQNQADLVSMMVPSADGCGLGYVNYPTVPDDAPWAFTVVRFNCALDNFSFAHELGHNMGMMHDRATSGMETSPRCDFGSVFTNPRGRSVMSYPSACDSCPRFGLYSTPLTLNIGFFNFGPFGVACDAPQLPDGTYNRADDRQQLYDAAFTVAGWR